MPQQTVRSHLREKLARAGATKSSDPPVAFREFFYNPEFRMHHRYNDQLSNAVERLDGVLDPTAIPTTHHQRPLVIRIDQTYEIAQDNSVVMSEAGARKDDGGEPGIGDMDGYAGGDQLDVT